MSRCLRIIAVLFLTIIALNGCKPEAKLATVTLKFNHVAAGSEIILDDVVRYTAANGQMFSTSLIKYYIGQIQLIKDDGTPVNVPGYHLINMEQPGSKLSLDINQVPAATYKSLQFCLGVDSVTNSKAQIGGDLDVMHGMFWEMTGYTFFKHEGKYKKNDGTTDALVLHYGLNRGFVPSINIPLNGMAVRGGSRIVEVVCDIAKIYPAPYDFNVDNFHMATDPSEYPWVAQMKIGLGQAFSLGTIK